MLTKEERSAIAERFISYDGNKLYFAELFKCLFGREIPRDATTKGSAKTVIDCLIDLCDTSNMVELPRGKDGEVIHIGDTVANGADGQICRVRGYEFKLDDCSVLLTSDRSHIWTYSRPDTLTHKKLVTPKLLSTQIRRVIDKGEMTSLAMAELFDIADQLENLGDSDGYEDKGEDSNGSC